MPTYQQNKKCEICQNQIPDDFQTLLCMDCYKKIEKENEAKKEQLETVTVKEQTPKEIAIKYASNKSHKSFRNDEFAPAILMKMAPIIEITINIALAEKDKQIRQKVENLKGFVRLELENNRVFRIDILDKIEEQFGEYLK